MISFGHLTLIMSLHYHVKCKSRSLAVYNKEFILASACVGSDNHWDQKLLKMCNLFNTRRIYFKTVCRWSEMTHQQSLWSAVIVAYVLLTSKVNVYRLRLCWKRTFWAHSVIKMMCCDMCDFLRDNNCYLCLSLFI